MVFDGWKDGDATFFATHGARLLLLGRCLLSPERITAEFAAAVESGDLGRTAEWPGAYTAVIISDGGITAYPDLAGQFPLYYSQRHGELLISTDPAQLAAAHRLSADPLLAAAHVVCPGVLPLWWGRSAYAGIGRVEGGMVLRARADRLEIEPSRLPLPVPGTTLAEGAARLRQALTEGIEGRCADRRVSADFSGGVDSSSVAFLAGGSSTGPVASVAYHQPLAPAADLADALRLAGLTSSVDLTVVRGSVRTLPFVALAPLAGRNGDVADAGTMPGVGEAGDDETGGGWPRSAEPSPRALTTRRDAARLAVAAASGARVHLTGEGGDAVLMAAPSYLADLARQHAMRSLWRHCGEYARLRHSAPVGLAASAIRLAGTSPRGALCALAAGLVRSDDATSPGWAGLVSWWQPTEAASWLTTKVRRGLADLVGDPATARVVPEGAGPADVAALADLRRSADAQRQLRALGRRRGLAVEAPFLDTAVVRAALSVPAATRADPWSYKPLLRSALTGLVPDDVFARQTKGDYSAEYYQGARQASAGLRALLRDSRLADLGVMEPGPVLAALDRMTAGVAVPLGPLNMLLATEVWLRTVVGSAGMEVTAC
jgi:asparagine synthase (glutamine-hydrolysing)